MIRNLTYKLAFIKNNTLNLKCSQVFDISKVPVKIIYCLCTNVKYRSRTEIVSNILDAANGGGTTKTKLMYKAYISYNQLKEYLSLLIENNLLEYRDGTKTFKTTEKGLHFLKMHNEIKKLLPQTTTVKND